MNTGSNDKGIQKFTTHTLHEFSHEFRYEFMGRHVDCLDIHPAISTCLVANIKLSQVSKHILSVNAIVVIVNNLRRFTSLFIIYYPDDVACFNGYSYLILIIIANIVGPSLLNNSRF